MLFTAPLPVLTILSAVEGLGSDFLLQALGTKQAASSKLSKERVFLMGVLSYTENYLVANSPPLKRGEGVSIKAFSL